MPPSVGVEAYAAPIQCVEPILKDSILEARVGIGVHLGIENRQVIENSNTEKPEITEIAGSLVRFWDGFHF